MKIFTKTLMALVMGLMIAGSFICSAQALGSYPNHCPGSGDSIEIVPYGSPTTTWHYKSIVNNIPYTSKDWANKPSGTKLTLKYVRTEGEAITCFYKQKINSETITMTNYGDIFQTITWRPGTLKLCFRNECICFPSSVPACSFAIDSSES